LIVTDVVHGLLRPHLKMTNRPSRNPRPVMAGHADPLPPFPKQQMLVLGTVPIDAAIRGRTTLAQVVRY
jgi:hypothetical protein